MLMTGLLEICTGQRTNKTTALGSKVWEAIYRAVENRNQID